jgi:Ca-activated chloride channel family protein
VDLYSPWVLLLLLLTPLAGYLMLRRGGRARLRFSSLRDAKRAGSSWRIMLRSLLVVVRMVCIVLLVVALARPREGSKIQKISTKGVALELVVDRSGSMEAQMNYKGRQMSRLEVVKQVLGDFVDTEGELEGRPNDLMGLVTFARYADTVCPLVHAHDALQGFLNQTQTVPQRSEENATSIGDALALAAARLKKAEEEIVRRNAQLKASPDSEEAKESKPEFEIKSKAIILLTDGRSNAGRYQPLDAAELARQWDIKIYTIGIGGGEAFTRVQGPFGDFMMPARQELDEGLLKAIAEKTNGFYGRAGDGEALKQIVERIDEQEKSEIQSVQYSRYEEKFSPLALWALMALALEVALSCTVFRKIP